MAAESLFVNTPGLQSQSQYIPPNTVNDQGALAKKLSEVMHEVSHVEKAGVNKFQNYNYQRATDMAQAVRKSLAARHIVMLPDIIDTRSYEVPAKEGVMQAVDLKVRYTFVDGDSGATLSFVGMGTGFDKGDKAVYKAHTGALKYALKDFFMIPEEGDDPEADESTDKHVQGKPSAKKPPTTEHTTEAVKEDSTVVVTLELRKVDEPIKDRKGNPMLTMLTVPTKGGCDMAFSWKKDLFPVIKTYEGKAIKVSGVWMNKGFCINRIVEEDQ